MIENVLYRVTSEAELNGKLLVDENESQITVM